MTPPLINPIIARKNFSSRPDLCGWKAVQWPCVRVVRQCRGEVRTNIRIHNIVHTAILRTLTLLTFHLPTREYVVWDMQYMADLEIFVAQLGTNLLRTVTVELFLMGKFSLYSLPHGLSEERLRPKTDCSGYFLKGFILLTLPFKTFSEGPVSKR